MFESPDSVGTFFVIKLLNTFYLIKYLVIYNVISKFTFVGLIKELKMKRLITLTLLFAGFFAWATNHQVAVSSNVFTPSSLTITVGDTVTWTNTSGSHNVDGRTATYPANPASFYSGTASGSLWTYSYTFTVAGSYTYDCTPHVGFGMVGFVR